MKKLIIKTDEDKCVGCNKCIFECPVNANSAKIVDDKNKISVNPDRCIQCGECIRVCDHGARSFCDDTEEFFERLKAGSKITVLAAPAVRNNFQDYKKLLGFLRKAGVNLIFDVSFGADIATWAYLKAIKERHIASMIAQPCPVIVSYIQMYNAELIPFLAPIHSPAMCAAIYLRKYKNITDELAFISPCIGKKVEFEDENTGGHIKYNVTISKLQEYLAEHRINLSQYPSDSFDDSPCGLGFTFSRPGGLRENVAYYTGGKAWVKQVEGIGDARSYLEQYKKRIRANKQTPLLVDVLNCKHGCNIGTATDQNAEIDDIDYKTNQTKNNFLEKNPDPQDSPLFRTFEQTFSLDDYSREYTDCSRHVQEASESDIEKAFEQLGKNTPESRNINCFACGYGSCLKLAAAVADGNNDVRNCVNYSRIKLKSGKDEFDTIFKSLEDRISGINDNLENIIGSSLDLDKISIQTRLISLNASIESAHAGEYGKCFAVVASEIKNLADKSEIIVGSNKDKQESIVRDIQTFEKEIKAIKEKIDGILQ